MTLEDHDDDYERTFTLQPDILPRQTALYRLESFMLHSSSIWWTHCCQFSLHATVLPLILPAKCSISSEIIITRSSLSLTSRKVTGLSGLRRSDDSWGMIQMHVHWCLVFHKWLPCCWTWASAARSRLEANSYYPVTSFARAHNLRDSKYLMKIQCVTFPHPWPFP